jgi:serine/threonine-protein kinase RsbW
MPYYRCPGCGLTVHSAGAFAASRICSECSTRLPADARLYPTPPASRQIRRVMAARPDAAGKARHAVRGLPLDTPTLDKLELLVSELVTNAVLHAGISPEDPISVHMTTGGRRVRVAVHDGGRGFDAPAAGDPGGLDPGGRGCLIVDALSDEWGIDCDAGGCTVWCEVQTEEQPGEAVDRGVTDGYLSQLALQMVSPVRELGRKPLL